MATIEFIQKRIESKKKEVEKLSKKLERIEKAKATNWEKNPHYYNEYDLKYTLRDLEEAKEGLAKYEADLEVAQHKANSRNIKVILDFLEGWKDRARKYYEDCVPKYYEAQRAYYDADSKLCDWHNHRYIHEKEVGEEEYERIEKELNNERKRMKANYHSWNFLTPYLENKAINYERLNKDLNAEADRKYDFIIERTQAIVTEITDASFLRIGDKGDLNGYIIGTAGKAKVETIGAGGYNENIILDSGRHGQCFHYRTLINPIK